jgi:DNA-binding PadR family transcriptional regulator
LKMRIRQTITRFLIIDVSLSLRTKMDKTLLLREESKTQEVKEITLLSDPEKLKLVLNALSWKMLKMLSEQDMYPLEIARKLGIHEQKVYYHIRKLCKAGAIIVVREEEKKGATAKYYRASAPAFGIELPHEYRAIKKISLLGIEEKIQEFFREFVRKDGTFEGKIVVGSPTPHGPFKTSARDGHYASHLTFFLGQFAKPPDDFAIKLDVDVKAEKEEKNNLILVGGPGTNLLAEEVNECLPTRFNMKASEEGFMFGGLVSKKTGIVYTADAVGVVAKFVNPWDKNKRIIVLAGNKAVGTKACVLALTDYWQKTLKDYDGEPFERVIQGFDLNGDGKVDSIEVLE